MPTSCICEVFADHLTKGRLRGFCLLNGIGDRRASYSPLRTLLLVTLTKFGVEDSGGSSKTASSSIDETYWKLSSVGVYSLFSFRGSVRSLWE